MERLHIPLSRHTQTTRRTRWVVWLLGIVAIALLLIPYWISSLWFSRDAIYHAAPDDAVAAFRFFLGGQKQEIVQTLLKNIPLISNRSLTLADLSIYLNGEIVFFLHKNGDHSVAVRIKNDLPQSLLDAQKITQQSISKNIILLSETKKNTRPMRIKAKWFTPLPWPHHQWIGELTIRNEQRRAFIFDEKKQIVLHLPQLKNVSHTIKNIPEQSVAYLATGNSVTREPIALFFEASSTILSSVLDEDSLEMLKNLSKSQGEVVFVKDDRGTGLLLVSHLSKEQGLDPKQILSAISTLSEPKIQKTMLSDGTVMQELISDSSIQSIEQVTILGLPSNRIIMKNNTEWYSSIKENSDFLLTNREFLLKFAIQNSKNDAKNQICKGNLVGIKLKPAFELFNTNKLFANPSLLHSFSDKFSSIGLEKKMYSSKLILCK